MEELDRITVNWSNPEVLDYPTKVKVFMALVSSFGDLSGSLANNKPIKEDIGNCIMYCSGLVKGGLIPILKLEPTKHSTPMVPQASYYLGAIAEAIVTGEDEEETISNFLHQLEGIATTRHTSLEESWYIAATCKGLIDE